MTPQTIATIAARLVGLVLLVQAVMLVPSIYFFASRPRLTDQHSLETKIPTNSPAYESAQRARERARESMERTDAMSRRAGYPLYFSIGLHAAAGLLFVFCSREIADWLCRGLDSKP